MAAGLCVCEIDASSCTKSRSKIENTHTYQNGWNSVAKSITRPRFNSKCISFIVHLHIYQSNMFRLNNGNVHNNNVDKTEKRRKKNTDKERNKSARQTCKQKFSIKSILSNMMCMYLFVCLSVRLI